MRPVQMSQFEFRYQARNVAEHKIIPNTAPYNRQFSDGAWFSFHKFSKKSMYAFLYGSFSESLTWNDFFNCYLMGGEL
jgi:hypothetical protein